MEFVLSPAASLRVNSVDVLLKMAEGVVCFNADTLASGSFIYKMEFQLLLHSIYRIYSNGSPKYVNCVNYYFKVLDNILCYN